MIKLIDEKLKEFNKHVWDHTKDDFFKKFVNPKKITDDQKKILKEIICILCKNNDDKACDKIYKIFESQSMKDSIIPLILQLVGSTRNKILTDLKAMLKDTTVPAKPEFLIKHESLLRPAEKYITIELKRVFSTIIDKDCNVDDDTLYLILDILNQSTWSGFIRQEKAKRTGHYAEYCLVKVLDKMNIPFEPRKKLENPISKDVKFHGISFDVVIPDKIKPKICFKATVHTSNVGQYGKSKDSLEVEEAINKMASMSKDRPKLVAFVDGVGLSSNMSGLINILEHVKIQRYECLEYKKYFTPNFGFEKLLLINLLLWVSCRCILQKYRLGILPTFMK